MRLRSSTPAIRDELASDYVALREKLPNLTVVGGCCGTDHRHIAAISSAWAQTSS